MKRSAGDEANKGARQRPRVGNDEQGMSILFQAMESKQDEDTTEDSPQQADNQENSTASDVAVAGVAAAAAAAAAGPPEEAEDSKLPGGVTYPKPRNFAERLMCVLEKGLANDCVWWVGNGKAVGLRPKHLKKGMVLKQHFNVKDYSGFIRNCNRWGFRRVAYYQVPDGVVTYENSLFQKDQPHLVKRMRMDSDVQEVYARRSNAADSQSSAAQGGGNPVVGLIPQQGALQGQSGVASFPVQQLASFQPVPAASSGGGLSIGSGGPMLNQQTGAPLPKQPIFESIPSDGTDRQLTLLKRIMDLSKNYLAQPNCETPHTKALRTVMQLLQVLGVQCYEEQKRQQEEEEARKKQQQAAQMQAANSNTSDVVAQLARLIAQAAQQNQMNSQPQPQPQPQQQNQGQGTMGVGKNQAIGNAPVGQQIQQANGNQNPFSNNLNNLAPQLMRQGSQQQLVGQGIVNPQRSVTNLSPAPMMGQGAINPPQQQIANALPSQLQQQSGGPPQQQQQQQQQELLRQMMGQNGGTNNISQILQFLQQQGNQRNANQSGQS